MAQLRPNKPRTAATIATSALVLSGVALLVALSCDGALPDRNSLRPAPASSSARARARAQRAARKLAMEQQGPRLPAPADLPDDDIDDAGLDAEADATMLDGGSTDDADAGERDASLADASTPADAGPFTPASLCQQLCQRAIACAKEMMEDELGPLDDAMRERMRTRLKANEQKCRKKCLQLVTDPNDQASAEECLSRDSCKSFMSCMEDVMSSED